MKSPVITWELCRADIPNYFMGGDTDTQRFSLVYLMSKWQGWDWNSGLQMPSIHSLIYSLIYSVIFNDAILTAVTPRLN